MTCMLRARLVSLALVLLACAVDAGAVEVQGLYQAEVPIATRELAERERAFKSALETVLVKATGSRRVTDQPAANEMLASPSRYVQKFGYRELDRDTAIWVQFDGAAVQAALTQAQLPVWVDERPATLLWLAIERADDRKLIAEDSSHPARVIVQSVAAQRAIPILLPLLDIEDLSQVSITDVLGGFDDALVEASSRYGPDAVAIARATRIGDDNWHADWRLSSGGRTLQWSFEGVSLAAVLTEGVHALADTFGQRLAVIENVATQGGMLVAVEDVDSLEDYARLRGYLDDLALVQEHRLYLVQPGYASFWLQTSGEPADVRRLISLGAILDEMPATATRGVGNDGPMLHFRLLQ